MRASSGKLQIAAAITLTFIIIAAIMVFVAALAGHFRGRIKTLEDRRAAAATLQGRLEEGRAVLVMDLARLNLHPADLVRTGSFEATRGLLEAACDQLIAASGGECASSVRDLDGEAALHDGRWVVDAELADVLTALEGAIEPPIGLSSIAFEALASDGPSPRFHATIVFQTIGPVAQNPPAGEGAS